MTRAEAVEKSVIIIKDVIYETKWPDSFMDYHRGRKDVIDLIERTANDLIRDK
jgi:hypothetical protein